MERMSFPYVLVGPKGVVYLGLHEDEDGCWKIALGWPSKDEIESKKAQGFRVYQATLTWKEA